MNRTYVVITTIGLLLIGSTHADSEVFSKGLNLLSESSTLGTTNMCVEEKKKPSRSWCSDFMNKVCGFDEDLGELDEIVETKSKLQGRAEILQFFSSALVKNAGTNSNTVTKLNSDIKNHTGGPKFRGSIQRGKYERIRDEWLEKNPSIWKAAIRETENHVLKVSEISQSQLEGLFKDIKLSLSNLIDSTSGISDGHKKQMKQKMQAVDYITGDSLRTELRRIAKKEHPKFSETALDREVVKRYTEFCGIDGQAINAGFYPPYNKVVLCPGFIAHLKFEDAEKGSDVLTGLSFVLGHEISHSFDGIRYSAAYTKMKECYRNNYRSKVKDPIFYWTRKSMMDPKMGEISADYWGTRVMADRLSKEKAIPGEAIRVVTVGTKFLCGSTDEGNDEHPGASFRLNLTIAGAPEMRKVLGCKGPTDEKPACVMSGRIPVSE